MTDRRPMAVVRRVIIPLVVWLAAAVILGFAAQGVRANGQMGVKGSTAEVPLLESDLKMTAPVRATSMTQPVLVWSHFSSSKSYVTEVAPVSVTEGKMSDFNLADPGEVAGMRVFYVVYTLRYVRGAAVPTYPDVKVQLLPGKGKAILPPNGLKNWNASPCQIPKLAKGFAFGKGTTMTMCAISFARKGDPTTVLHVEPRSYQSTPYTLPQDIRWPVQS